MKKSFLFFTAAMAASCGFAAGTLHTAGSFLEGAWRAGDSYITPSDAGIATSEVLLTAIPDAGYGISGWYYRTTQYISGSQLLSNWTELSDSSGKMSCTIPAEAPFATSDVPFPINYIALNLRYVKFNLSFNYNGGSGATSAMTDLYVTNNIVLPMPNSRTGYDFTGWKCENGTTFQGGVTLENVLDLGIGNVDTNFTLLAQWKAKTSAVTFGKVGGTDGSTSVTAIYDQPMPTPCTAPTRVGYTFGGYWDSTLNPNGKQYYDANMNSVRNWDKTDANVTLYAKWTANTYKVTLGKNGGTGGDDSVTVTYGQSMPSCTAPSQTGYTFLGYWDSTLNPNGKQYYDADMNSVRSWDKTSANPSLWAKWVANTYTIAFNANGGTGSMSDISMAYGVATNLTLNAFANVGYTFAGWATSPNGNVVYANGAAVSNLASAQGATVTLYAKWTVNTCTVTFGKNGGTGGADSVTAIYGQPMPTARPAPTRTGYTFVGYFNSTLNPNGKQYYDANMNSVRNWDNTAATASLWAKWTTNTYTIAFNANGGSGNMSDILMTYNVAANLTPNAFSKTGYAFTGWATNSNGIAVYADGASVKNLATAQGATVTLYATWSANTSAVTFGKVGGTGGTTSVTATYGQPMPTPCTAPTKTGYTFGGYWDSTILPNGKQYYSPSMNSVRNWDKTDANVTLYAKWTANEYTVTLGKVGGTGGTTSVTATYGQPMPTPCTAPTKTGYTFGGYWDSTLNPNAKQYYDANMNSVRNWDKTTANPSLWAKWQAHTYAIKFDANGGGGTMSSMLMTYDVATNLTINAFTKEGYTFMGWATEPTGAVVYEDGVGVRNLLSEQDAEMTLYAKWEANTYYVRFNPNGGTGAMPILTNRYDVATVFPENAFTRSEFWRFSCWSNTVDGTTAAPGDPLVNLTPEPGATVVIDAVWATTLSKLALAMHCYNLDWTNRILNAQAPVWIDEWGAGLGYQDSGSRVSQELPLEYLSGNPMQAVVSTNGTMSFYCKMVSGNAGQVRIWIAEKADYPFNDKNNLYKAEVQLGSGDVWTRVEFEVPQTNFVMYVNIASRESESRESVEKMCIDMMTWEPAGSPVEPTDKDAAVITDLTVGVGGFSFAFMPDPRFAYKLHGTNELTVVRTLWPVLLSTNGSEKISFTLPIEATEPKMFYYLETIAK